MSFINKGQKEGDLFYKPPLHFTYVLYIVNAVGECSTLNLLVSRIFDFPVNSIAGNPGIPWCLRFAFLQKNTYSWLRKTQWVHQIIQKNGLLHLPRFLRTCPMCSGVETLFLVVLRDLPQLLLLFPSHQSKIDEMYFCIFLNQN